MSLWPMGPPPSIKNPHWVFLKPKKAKSKRKKKRRRKRRRKSVGGAARARPEQMGFAMEGRGML